MALLETITSPAALKALPAAQLPALAEEIRTFLVDDVSKTGGHLGPNLGVVELTIALHRVFDSPRDTIVFDTGHQSYVHKLLTGRQDFSNLKKQGGLSGYPSRAESEHDVVENSHASTALSWADGIAKARRLRGERDRHTVAVIGDGALTGGMAWEAINNIAVDKDLPLVIVVNDNERSYAPTIGGLADHLATLRTTRGYERFLDWGKHTLNRTPVVGGAMYETLHGMKKGIKDIVAPQGMFEDLGLKYLGPVDGHDEQASRRRCAERAAFGGPVIVHVITQKGRGYDQARNDEADQFHAVGVSTPRRACRSRSPGRIWTDEFSDELVAIGRERHDVVAITAAMLIPVGLEAFAAAYPDRVFDVGIAEQHAVTMASGLAFGGLHPVVAVYATFLNRAFDQLLMDCALHRAGVTVRARPRRRHRQRRRLAQRHVGHGAHRDRAGPAPRRPARRRAGAPQLREAVDVSDGPTVIRFPKGDVADPLPRCARLGDVDVLLEPAASADEAGSTCSLVGVGCMAATALAVAEKLEAQGRARGSRPALGPPGQRRPRRAGPRSRGRGGGRGQPRHRRRRACRHGGPARGGCRTAGAPARHPEEFLAHASRGQILEEIGLTPDAIAASCYRRGPTAGRGIPRGFEEQGLQALVPVGTPYPRLPSWGTTP